MNIERHHPMKIFGTNLQPNRKLAFIVTDLRHAWGQLSGQPVDGLVVVAISHTTDCTPPPSAFVVHAHQENGQLRHAQTTGSQNDTTTRIFTLAIIEQQAGRDLASLFPRAIFGAQNDEVRTVRHSAVCQIVLEGAHKDVGCQVWACIVER